MTICFLIYFHVFKKHVFALIVAVAISYLPIQAQINYISSDERREAGMGVERVAVFYSPAYESKLAKNNEEIRWIQLDLGEKKVW